MSHDEPTLPERRQAEVLARWLQGQPPPGEIPEDLDQDVVEAVLALRPDLAPAPALTADDILAGVTTGPLAAQSAPALADQAGSAARPAAAATPPLPQPANTPNRRWVPWAVAGLGSLAAAAAILIVATATLTGEPSMNAPIAALEPAPEDAATGNAGRTATRDLELAPPAPSQVSADQPQAEPSQDRVARADETSTGIPAPSSRSRPAAAGSTTGGAAAPASSGRAPAEDLGDAVADLDELEEQDEEIQAQSFDDLHVEGMLEEEANELAPVIRADEVTATRAESASSRSMDTVAVQKKERQPRSKAAGESAPPPAPASAAGRDSASDTDLERQARPTAPPAAETVAVQNLLASGQPEEARDSAQRLLDAGGLSDLRRADLYWALGKAHEALGQSSKATSAWREAVRLRQR